MNIVDLRIGNYVEYNGMSAVVTELLSPKPRQPESFNNVPVVELLCGGLTDCPLSEINPIPITEEILLKLPDFERLHQSLFKTRDGKYSLHETISSNWIFYRDSTNLCFIKSLHQLQNLFHALTGKELEVSL